MPTQAYDDVDSLEGDPECKDDALDPSEFEDEYDDEPGGEVTNGQPPVYYSDDGGVYEDIYEVIDYNQERRAWHKSRRNWYLVITLLLVGLAVVLAIVFTGSDTPPSSNGVPLQEPPPDLDKRCSISAIKQGRELCMEACEPAECCDFPATLPLSCLEGNQQKCLTYHAQCSNLDADSHDKSSIPSSVPPAPANLASLCATSSLKTVDGFTGCHSACKHAECCYEDAVGTCTHEECAGYAPCLALTATDYVHEDIPGVVDHVCASDHLTTLEGRAQCRQACSLALCCFPGFSSNEATCLQPDTSFCSQYTKCNELESVNPVDATPEEIKLTCADTKNIPGHISLCELVCQKGACCFSDVGCDKVNSQVHCDDYKPCHKVFIAGDGGTDTPATGESSEQDGGDSVTVAVVDRKAIDAACEKGGVVEVVGVPGQQSLCAKVCEPGKCCWEKQGCQVDDSERYCTNFSACSKVFGKMTTGDDAAGYQNPVVDTEALKAACGAAESLNASDVVDLKECKALCEQGTCCYSKDWCSVPDPEQFCANFGYCDKIIDDDGGDDDSLDDDNNNDDTDLKDFADNATDTGGGEDGPSSLDKKTIDAACAGTGESEICRELCDEAKCCFQTDGCDAEPSNLHCTNFIACLKFHVEMDYSESNVDPSSDSTALQAACADNTEVEIPGQPSLCETLCAHGDCCFKPEGCSTEDLIRYWSMDDPKQFCAPYGVCLKFHT